jgi:hypothetical protein
MHACVRACVLRACVLRACERACVRACVRAYSSPAASTGSLSGVRLRACVDARERGERATRTPICTICLPARMDVRACIHTRCQTAAEDLGSALHVLVACRCNRTTELLDRLQQLFTVRKGPVSRNSRMDALCPGRMHF